MKLYILPTHIMAPKAQGEAAAPATTFNDIVAQIAEQNAIIKAKSDEAEAKAAELATLTAQVEKLQADKEQLERDNRITLASTKETEERAKADVQKTRDAVGEEMAKLDAEREGIAKERAELESLQETTAKLQSEALRLKAENEQAQAEVDAKTKEAKRNSEGRKEELASIEVRGQEVQVQINQLEKTKAETLAAAEENRVILARITEAQAGAQENQDSLRADREALEMSRINAAREVSCLDYKEGVVKNLIGTLRQSLHSYLQYAGTAIAFAEVNEDAAKVILDVVYEQFPQLKEETIEVGASASNDYTTGFDAGYVAGEKFVLTKLEEAGIYPTNEPETELTFAPVPEELVLPPEAPATEGNTPDPEADVVPPTEETPTTN